MLICQEHIPDTVTDILILCHGYGADGRDLTYGMERLYKACPTLACFYPDAPIPGPFGGYQWFSLDDFTPQKLTDITYLETLIQRTESGVSTLKELARHLMNRFHLDSRHIFLGGFSQGGLIALVTALSWDKPVAGILALSSVPILFEKAFPLEKVHQNLPILMTHGEEDDVIPEHAWLLGQEELKRAHQKLSAFSIPNLPHGIDETVLNHMITFIRSHQH